MSKKIEVSLEFIQQAYNAACTEWKEKIKQNVPEFKDMIECYKSGDRFKLGYAEYILARTDTHPSKMNLINLENGNLWDNGLEVKNYPSVSKNEFARLSKEHNFVKI